MSTEEKMSSGSSEKMESYTPCTPRDLELIVRGNGVLLEPSREMDEVFDRVFVGEGRLAQNSEYLNGIGITHVLNCAQGTDRFCVDTDQAFYDEVGIKFCGLEVQDIEESDIKAHFETTAQFIDSALAQEDGRVLIHCVVGFSRAPTVAIAYLMMRQGMTAKEATELVRSKREIGPNDGFLEQLCKLDKELFQKRTCDLS